MVGGAIGERLALRFTRFGIQLLFALNAEAARQLIGAASAAELDAGVTAMEADVAAAVAAADAAAIVEQNIQSVNYTLALTDAGKHVYSENTANQDVTVPTNASVPFLLGTPVTIVNNGTNNITVVTTGITMIWAGTTLTGNRTVAPKGMVTMMKIKTNTWIINGSGIT
jgi:hypothetical protein